MLIEHYLYFIGHNIESEFGKYSGYVKVGISNNPRARLKDLDNAGPVKLKLILVLKLTSKVQAELLEAGVHSKLNSYREKGEWFRYSQHTLKWINKTKRSGYPIVTSEWL